MTVSFRRAGRHLEGLMTGALPADVRRNMHTEVRVALAYGAANRDQRKFDDPDTYAMFLLGSNVNPIGTPSLNLAHLDDPAFDDIVWRTRAMAERSDRVAAYPSFEQELAATVPIIWLSESPPLVIASDRVRGIGTASLPDGGEALAFLSGRHGMAELAINRG